MALRLFFTIRVTNMPPKKEKKPKAPKEPKPPKVPKEKKPKREGFRDWVFVINNYTADDVAAVEKMSQSSSVQYIVYGLEVGKECGTPHIQGYVYFRNIRSFESMKKDLERANIQPRLRQSTPTCAAVYCKKDGNFKEVGVCPLTQEEKGRKESARWETAWTLAKAGDIEAIEPRIRLSSYSTLCRIANDYRPMPPTLPVVDCHWYHGPSGSCKSVTARVINPPLFVKGLNRWHDLYKDESVMLIDEWNPDVPPYLNQLLKTWCDHYPYPAEIKGSVRMIRPAKIIVTSNYTLKECFGHDSVGLLVPLTRRFKVRTFVEGFTYADLQHECYLYVTFFDKWREHYTDWSRRFTDDDAFFAP